jgi:hypothetical protein
MAASLTPQATVPLRIKPVSTEWEHYRLYCGRRTNGVSRCGEWFGWLCPEMPWAPCHFLLFAGYHKGSNGVWMMSEYGKKHDGQTRRPSGAVRGEEPLMSILPDGEGGAYAIAPIHPDATTGHWPYPVGETKLQNLPKMIVYTPGESLRIQCLRRQCGCISEVKM